MEVRMYIRKWELVYRNLLIHNILQGAIASYWSARRSKLNCSGSLVINSDGASVSIIKKGSRETQSSYWFKLVQGRYRTLVTFEQGLLLLM